MKSTTHSYFVVMIEYGRKGCEAIVDPEITRRDVAARIRSGEYPRDRISFIHHVNGLYVEDLTSELIEDASQREDA